MADPIEPNKTVPGTDEGSDKDKSSAQEGEFDTDPWAGIDGATEGWDTLSASTATPSATTENSSTTTATPSISEVNNRNVDAVDDIVGTLKDLGVDFSKGEEGVLKGTMKGWEKGKARARAAGAPTISTSQSTEANKKDEARKAASNRKREARRASLAEYEAEAKRKKSFFGNIGRRRKSAPADSSGSNTVEVDELEWRSFNTWVVDLTSDLKNFSISFNQIVSKKRKEFEVEPLKNDETYNPYNPVYVIHYFKDFWDKIKGFYGAEKVKLEGSNDVDEFIKTIDGENWEKYGWENPKFSTKPKNLKGEEPELNKNNEVIKAFEGWLKIIKKNVTNLQDKIGKENIENNKKYKVIDDESVNELWQYYGRYIEEYNKFVKDQNRLVDEQKKDKILSTLIDANDRKSREIRERIVNPIFSNGEFENLTPADLLKNFSDKKAPECKESGQLVGKYERLKAILYDAEMIEGAGGLCKCLYDFHKEVSLGSKISPMAKVLNQRTKNIRGCFVDPKRAVELAGSFEDLLDAIKGSIDKLRGVYNNVQGALSGDASIIGSDHEFSFGKDEKNCWHVYQNETGVEKEIGSIAEVYYKVVKKDGKQEKNAYLRDLNGKVTLYDKAFIYGRLSSYLCGSMGYLSFENNFTPNGEIECYYTDEEGKENSVTFNANGMAIEINRQGKITTVNENSNAFKQLKQAFEGNQSSSIPPQGNLDINNNEKNEGGINMANDKTETTETETTKTEATELETAKKQLMDFVGEYNYLLLLRSEFAKRTTEKQRETIDKYILTGYDGAKWWDKYQKYEVRKLTSDETKLCLEWVAVVSDIAGYVPVQESERIFEEVSSVSREIPTANNERKLDILKEYHTKAKELLDEVKSKLEGMNLAAKAIDGSGKVNNREIEGLQDKNLGEIDEFKNEFDTFIRNHAKFLKEKTADDADDIINKIDEKKFNKETWKATHEKLYWSKYVNVVSNEKTLELPAKCVDIAKRLNTYFATESSEYKEFKEIIDVAHGVVYKEEGNGAYNPTANGTYEGKNALQRLGFMNKAISLFKKTLEVLNAELNRLQKAADADNGDEKANENVSETNVNEDAKQKEELKTTETVEAPKSEEGAKPAEASGAATRENGLPSIPQGGLPSAPVPVDENGMPTDGLPLTPPEQAAANGGQEADENVSGTNVNEDAEQKEEPETTETAEASESEELKAAGQVINEAVKKYNEFVGNYNGFVDKFKVNYDLKTFLIEVKAPTNEGSAWLNGIVRNKMEINNVSYTIEELNAAWSDLISKLVKYLPEGNSVAFSTKANEISMAIISDNDIGNSEKLKLMEKYNKMCDKMLNYTNSVLKRLKRKAEHKGYLREETSEENKGLFSRIKGKASKLVRKGKKVVAHKLDSGKKELDAAQKELKVLDNSAGANGTEGRFVKQSVMDQPEYAAFKAVGQVISNNSGLGNLLGISSKFNSDDSSLKQFQSKLKDALKGNSLYKWRAEKDNEATGDTVLGVMFIGIAYLPSGSKGIEAACKGLSVGGIKGYNGTIGEAHKLMRAMKKGTRKGLEGHNLVKDPDVKEGLKYFVNEDSIPKIESKFSTLLKLKRKAAKLGSKAKETAKKAATKIGKSSVGRAAKGAASSAVDAVKKLPGKFKKSKPEATVENASAGASVPANNVSSEKKPGRAKKAWNTVKSVFSRSKKKTTNNEEDE